jgi:hypothetical protein
MCFLSILRALKGEIASQNSWGKRSEKDGIQGEGNLS